jgi:4-amino-4-deoxy-L-arabinose transferase-like glycosyltransferase
MYNLCNIKAAAKEHFNSFSRSQQNWAIFIGFIFFIANVSCIGKFGMGWDEPVCMARGEDAVEQLLHRSLSPTEAQMDYDPSHPVLYAACNFTAREVLVRYFGWQQLTAGHLLNILTASIGVIAIFYLGRALFGTIVGFVAQIWMVFFPRFVAHAHYNPKDVPAMVFATLALLLLYLAANKGNTRYWLLAALSFSIGVGTKLDALFVLPIFFIPCLFLRCQQFKSKPQIRNVLLFVWMSVALIFISWPRLWTHHDQLFESIRRFSTDMMPDRVESYLGSQYRLTELPWHYMPLQLIAVIPLLSLFMSIWGMFMSARMLLNKQCLFENSIIWYWFVIPLIIRCQPGVSRYDGMRHVFLAVPALAVFAGIAVDKILTWWRSRKLPLAALVALGCGAIGWLSWQTIQAYPQLGSYLNEGVRMTMPPQKLGQCFDFYGWGAVYKSGIDWVNSHASDNACISGGSHYPLLSYYTLRNDVHLREATNNCVTTYLLIDPRDTNFAVTAGTQRVSAIQCYGADLLLIYVQQSP